MQAAIHITKNKNDQIPVIFWKMQSFHGFDLITQGPTHKKNLQETPKTQSWSQKKDEYKKLKEKLKKL